MLSHSYHKNVFKKGRVGVWCMAGWLLSFAIILEDYLGLQWLTKYVCLFNKNIRHIAHMCWT